ncbi:hypothetical protein KC930_00225 [Candidatus Saccharibacteria bacterium]|nr:hypothetical protein [Candidatus Saccharibacteria bacterium]
MKDTTRAWMWIFPSTTAIYLLAHTFPVWARITRNPHGGPQWFFTVVCMWGPNIAVGAIAMLIAYWSFKTLFVAAIAATSRWCRADPKARPDAMPIELNLGSVTELNQGGSV